MKLRITWSAIARQRRFSPTESQGPELSLRSYEDVFKQLVHECTDFVHRVFPREPHEPMGKVLVKGIRQGSFQAGNGH